MAQNVCSMLFWSWASSVVDGPKLGLGYLLCDCLLESVAHPAFTRRSSKAGSGLLMLRQCRKQRVLTEGVWFFFLIKLFFPFQQENKTFFFLWSKTNNFFSWHVTDKLFFRDMFEEPFNCETGMPGTVTCRHVDSSLYSRATVWRINISN